MVEFAIVLPILVILLFGIIEFGRGFSANLTVSHAAREGARELAVTGNAGAAEAVARSASSNLDQSKLSVTPGACSPGNPVNFTVNFTFDYQIPLTPFGGPVNLSSTGVMRCE